MNMFNIILILSSVRMDINNDITFAFKFYFVTFTQLFYIKYLEIDFDLCIRNAIISLILELAPASSK